MAYCQTSDVERYITPAVGADVAGAIAAAQKQVEQYTGDLFEPTTKTIYTETNRNHVADLPYTTNSISAVAAADTGTALSADAWTFENGTVPRIRVSLINAWSILIAGAEPYSYRSTQVARLNVTGSFGTPSVPAPIAQATALLAAQFLASTGFGTLTADAQALVGVPADVATISVEGYSVSYRDTTATTDAEASTTGLPAVDRLVAPYRRTKRARWF